MGLPGKSEGVVFSPVPCEIVSYEPERVGVSFLKEAVEKPAPIRHDLQQVCHMAESLDRLLQQALEYVQKVLVSPVPFPSLYHLPRPSSPPLSSSLLIPLFSLSTLSPFHLSPFFPPSSLSVTFSSSVHPVDMHTSLSHFSSCLRSSPTLVFPTDGVVLFSPQAGKVEGNPTAGRELMEAVSCMPQMDETKFESILNSTMQVRKDGISVMVQWLLTLSLCMQDHLMVVYLFNLVKTQLVLGEKLCKITS